MEIPTILLRYLHFELDLHMDRKLSKMRPKTKKLKLREMVGEGQDNFTTSPKTSYEISEPKSGDSWSTSAMAIAAKLGPCATFELKYRDESRLSKIMPGNPESKIQNSRWKHWTILKRHHTFSSKHPGRYRTTSRHQRWLLRLNCCKCCILVENS